MIGFVIEDDTAYREGSEVATYNMLNLGQHKHSEPGKQQQHNCTIKTCESTNKSKEFAIIAGGKQSEVGCARYVWVGAAIFALSTVVVLVLHYIGIRTRSAYIGEECGETLHKWVHILSIYYYSFPVRNLLLLVAIICWSCSEPDYTNNKR